MKLSMELLLLLLLLLHTSKDLFIHATFPASPCPEELVHGWRETNRPSKTNCSGLTVNGICMHFCEYILADFPSFPALASFYNKPSDIQSIIRVDP